VSTVGVEFEGGVVAECGVGNLDDQPQILGAWMGRAVAGAGMIPASPACSNRSAVQVNSRTGADTLTILPPSRWAAVRVVASPTWSRPEGR
jgi:hypothetical protein